MSLQLYPIPAAELDNSRYKGENAKRLLVVLSQEDASKHFELLSKILRAIGFDIDTDVHVLTLGSDESFSLFSSDRLSNYGYVISMGLPMKRLGLSLDLPVGIQRLEQVKVVMGPNLDRITGDEKVKRAFWTILKTEFAV